MKNYLPMPRINLPILSSFLHFGHFFTLASIFRGVRHPAQIQTDVLPRIWSSIGQWSLHAVQSQSNLYCKSIHKLHIFDCLENLVRSLYETKSEWAYQISSWRKEAIQMQCLWSKFFTKKINEWAYWIS